MDSRSVYILDNEFTDFHHNVSLHNVNQEVRILENKLIGGYAGLYFRNSQTDIIAAFNHTEDIGCGVGFRIDTSGIDTLGCHLFGNVVFAYNTIYEKVPSNNDEVVYTLRFFSCPDSVPSDSCLFAATYDICPPLIMQNFMGAVDSLRDIHVEFIDSTDLVNWIDQITALNPMFYPKTDSVTLAAFHPDSVLNTLRIRKPHADHPSTIRAFVQHLVNSYEKREKGYIREE